MAEAPRKFHIGMRNIKTALAATLCAFIYLCVDRNPTFACIGAIFGVGSDMGNSWLNGGNRLMGTILGGLLGMGLFRVYIIFYPDGKMRPLMLLMLAVGIIVLISLGQLLGWQGAIGAGGVVMCIILFNTPVESYVSYSVNRMIDTAVGVLIALLVNFLLPRERIDKIIANIKKYREQ